MQSKTRRGDEKQLYVIVTVTSDEQPNEVKEKIHALQSLGVEGVFLKREGNPAPHTTCELFVISENIPLSGIGVANPNMLPVEVLDYGCGFNQRTVEAIFSDWGGVTPHGLYDERMTSYLERKDRPSYVGGISHDKDGHPYHGHALATLVYVARVNMFDAVVMGRMSGESPLLPNVVAVRQTITNSGYQLPLFAVSSPNYASMKLLRPYVDGFILVGWQQTEEIETLISLVKHGR